jgi:hypothetical protein
MYAAGTFAESVMTRRLPGELLQQQWVSRRDSLPVMAVLQRWRLGIGGTEGSMDDVGSRKRFGVFEFDPQTRELTKHGVRLKMQEQPIQILAARRAPTAPLARRHVRGL